MKLWNIVRNELREMLTLRVLLPVVLMSLFFGMFGNMIGGIRTEIEKEPIIGIVVHDQDGMGETFRLLLEQRTEIVYNGTDESDGLDVVMEKGGTALVVVEEDFTSNMRSNTPGSIRIIWIMRGAGIMDDIPSGSLIRAMDAVSVTLSYMLIDDNNTVDAGVVISPFVRNETTIFRDRRIEGVTPLSISGVMASQTLMVPLVTMMVILMAGGSVISSMGQEKENKTLETLLTMPVSRTTIVAGKIAGNAIIGLIMATIYMVGFGRYMSSFGASGSDLDKFGLSLNVVDYLLVGASLFIAVFAGLAICMILGTFAKNFKSAQFLLFPVSMLTLVPMLIIMFMDFETLSLGLKVLIFVIPFSHPMMSVRFLMFDQYVMVFAGLGYLVIFSGILIAVAVRIFKSDRLIAGAPPRIGRILKGISIKR